MHPPRQHRVEAVVFVIDPTQSVAAFEIDEVLRGEPTHVVGTTSELAGQLEIDPSDLATARFSQIVINARTFETDSGNRDRAIRGPVILNSAVRRVRVHHFRRHFGRRPERRGRGW